MIRLGIILFASVLCTTAEERSISLSELSNQPKTFSAKVDTQGEFTWWLPTKADAYVLPISGGIEVQTKDQPMVNWLKRRGAWNLLTLPVVGARYGDQTIVLVVPWPHYAELVVTDRLGIRFRFPHGRHKATPCEVIGQLTGSDPLAVAQSFRAWRGTAEETGGIPRPRPLTEKFRTLPLSQRLVGAPHIYLWGPGHFSLHDVPRANWKAFAKALNGHPITEGFSQDAKKAVKELASAEWPMRYLTSQVAQELSVVLGDPETRPPFAKEFSRLINPPETWGDGLSVPLLNSLKAAGIDRALLVLSDLYGHTTRPDVVAKASELGYLIGPYDSYHSVHSPNAGPNSTWETAQFDSDAYEKGRVQNADGSGHGGFKGRGFHFSPAAAWPYVQRRVNGIRKRNPYTTWFIDCDATAECFDDFNPWHPATKADDVRIRRQRLRWLESELGIVVGSEGGSALYVDVIQYGHGVHTPYIGHLFPGFKDRKSPHYLGRHWPSDTPEISFKSIPVPPSLRSPYFDPKLRLPLYQAAFGDELLTTHHWSFDSFKFADIAKTRELLEILYLVPPMYHLNRESWSKRKDRIVAHFKFWSPIHRQLATAPLVGFKHLTEDRLVQQTQFQLRKGKASITVNFGERPFNGLASMSARVEGLPLDLPDYRAR